MPAGRGRSLELNILDPVSLEGKGGLVGPVLIDAEVELGRCACGGDVGRLGGQADMGEDAVDHGRVGDEGDEHAPAAAVGAGLEVFFVALLNNEWVDAGRERGSHRARPRQGYARTARRLGRP